jgi:peptide/nickel transport system permease protein
MTGYIVRRILISIPVIFIVAIMTFSITFLAPGDAAYAIAGEEATAEDIERITELMGLDRPFIVQFWSWFGGVLKGDFGRSLFTGHKVTELLANRVEPTISLTMMGLVLSVLIGVPLGAVAGWKANTWIDRVIMFFAVFGFSVPAFSLGFILILVFAVGLGWFPAIGYVSFLESVPGFFKSMTLPALSIAVGGAAIIARMTRSSMLEIMNEDYIRTARAKGLQEKLILRRHALRAASLPVATVVGLLLAGLLTGVVVTETVFTIPGLGRLAALAVFRRDIPVLQAVVLVLGAVTVFANLVTDIVYAYLDPRVRF